MNKLTPEQIIKSRQSYLMNRESRLKAANAKYAAIKLDPEAYRLMLKAKRMHTDAYRRDNPDRVLKAKRIWAAANRDKLNEKAKAYYQSHPEYRERRSSQGKAYRLTKKERNEEV